VAKSAEAFRTISEASKELGVPQHVLRHWEEVFGHIRPMRRAGGRRYYRPVDLDMLRGVRSLLYDERYTTKGVQKIFRENGAKYITEIGRRAGVGKPLDVRPELAKNINSDPSPVKYSDAIAEAETVSLTENSREVHEKLRALIDRLKVVQVSLDNTVQAMDSMDIQKPEGLLLTEDNDH